MTELPDYVPTAGADPQRPYKAYVAAVVAFVALLCANLAGRDDIGNMTVSEWLTIILGTLGTFGATYGVENPKALRR